MYLESVEGGTRSEIEGLLDCCVLTGGRLPLVLCRPKRTSVLPGCRQNVLSLPMFST